MTSKELKNAFQKCKDRSDKSKNEKYLEDVTCELCDISCLRVIEAAQCKRIKELH